MIWERNRDCFQNRPCAEIRVIQHGNRKQHVGCIHSVEQFSVECRKAKTKSVISNRSKTKVKVNARSIWAGLMKARLS